MSIQPTKRRNKKSANVSAAETPENGIIVTNHARLRYLQRVDAACPNPKQKLRQLFHAGTAVPAHPDVDEGRARRTGDVLVVYRGSVTSPRIVTVLFDTTTSDAGPEQEVAR